MVIPVLIIGGGLAGLISAIELSLAGIEVTVLEKKTYPHHKVCGEYLSNEVRDYLKSLGLDVGLAGGVNISKMQFTTPAGNGLVTDLDLGGFGLSRYRLDDLLYRRALETGVRFFLQTTVVDVNKEKDFFNISTTSGAHFQAEIVIGSYGKRAKLDRLLERSFMEKSSPFMAVKYHIRYDLPKDTIALHNFRNGYCGVSAIEDGRYCLCYLTDRTNLKKTGSIAELERTVLSGNPHLKQIFREAEFLYARPEVINEISFEAKQSVERHVIMAGDTAGLITPLCGNGMAMAIHGAIIAAEEILDYFNQHRDRGRLEGNYSARWRHEFSKRLWVGRTVQRFFGNPHLSELALKIFKNIPPLMKLVIRNTHGKVLTKNS